MFSVWICVLSPCPALRTRCRSSMCISGMCHVVVITQHYFVSVKKANQQTRRQSSSSATVVAVAAERPVGAVTSPRPPENQIIRLLSTVKMSAAITAKAMTR